jgi:hypothetical protein
VSEKKRFTSFAALRDWFTGKGDEQPDAPADSAPTYGEQDADDDPPDECPMGSEHEWVEIIASTAREPLHTYCQKCRQEWKE